MCMSDVDRFHCALPARPGIGMAELSHTMSKRCESSGDENAANVLNKIYKNIAFLTSNLML
jgi:hypothetical protein